MPQTLSQELSQEQRLLQQQRITQQHLLNVRLLSMPLAELEQSVVAALDDNPALERVADGDDDSLYGSSPDETTAETALSAEQEERQDELTRALSQMESDDESADEGGAPSAMMDAGREGQYRSDSTFRDSLLSQVAEETLSDSERRIVEYLIDSLDGDGLLRKELSVLVDEMAIYEYIDTSLPEVERLLHIVQTFDPAGVGARSLQECLRLQIERMAASPLRENMLAVVDKHFDLFLSLRWDKIGAALSLSDTQCATLRHAFRRLNPRPGAAAGESVGRSTQQITPDVTIYPARSDGRIPFEVNMGSVPHVAVAEEFTSLLDKYKKDGKRPLTSSERDALVFARRQVEQAAGYVSALQLRQRTIESTLRAIIAWQRNYFLTGEESDLRPMVLRDIAAATGMDISTISRVSNEKYAATPWGIVPLRFFFSDRFASQDADALSSRAVKIALKEIIDGEDKAAPYTDDTLVALMAERGFTIARRTVAKYRDSMSIPTARLRQQR